MLLDPRHAWIRQLAAFVVLLALWGGGAGRHARPMYAPMPSRVGAAL
jgi:hypothetical protein